MLRKILNRGLHAGCVVLFNTLSLGLGGSDVEKTYLDGR